MARAQVTPLVVSNDPDNRTVARLTRIDLKKVGERKFDEAWIQNLIDCHPSVLPIQEIEPAFDPIKSLCREMPTLSGGLIDNIFITADGNIVVVECKLWRNPEAQRKALAQILDYAKDLQASSYDDFEKTIATTRGEKTRFNLYEFSTEGDADRLDEASFIDTVSRNLRLGRLLLLIVGDGIKENLRAMASHLQLHAGIHFRLALVELAVYEAPESRQWLVVPSILASTVTIERGIVEIRDGNAIIVPSRAPLAKGKTLSEGEFFYAVDRLAPGTAIELKSFLAGCMDRNIQVHWDVGKTLRVRMTVGENKVMPLVINTNGSVDTGYDRGKNGLLRGFTEILADAIPGATVKETERTIFVKMEGCKALLLQELLDHRDGVWNALERLNTDLRNASRDEGLQ